MVVLMLGAGLCLLPLLLRLAVRLRLGIPLVYVLLMLTVFHGWYQAHTALADGILLLLVGAAALSWVVTLVRKSAEVLGDALAEHAAAKRLAQDCAAGKVDADQIDEATFASYLDTADMPDPDLLIRTSGELRTSNYLPFQSAYSELYFTTTYWPDFTPAELHKALRDYAGRSRRFGLTQEQIQ